MIFSVEDEAGEPVEFTCPDSISSRWTCGAILEGRTYPHLPFIGAVHTVLDVGANCGAMTLHLARRYPDAVIHAFEPGHEALSYLRRNVGDRPNVSIHPFGLSDVDGEATLVVDGEDIGKASVVHRPLPSAEDTTTSEIVALRSAGEWAREAGVDQIDILKVDVEGCEVDVLRSLGHLVAGVKVLHVEYDSRAARRELAQLIEPTHELYLGQFLTLDQGECTYVRSDLADHPDAVPRLREIFTRPT